MALNLRMPELADLKPKITVFGVGGAGGNAVNNMIEKSLEGADFVVGNTDSQALTQSKAGNKLQLGEQITEGLGAGAQPTIGAAAAEESIEAIVDHLAGSHMCFITAGMGGGTGTGAAPIIAQAARELGILTVGVVTKPFQFEGSKRMTQAEEGIEALQKVVDTLIIIPNQNLFRIANEKTTFTEAFALADDVLYQGVKGVTDLMVRPGIINLDFADVRCVMDEMGKAMMGTGEASGEDRAIQAAEKAIANPLLDEISLRGARGVLINVTGGHDLTLFELDEAANRIREEVDPEANIIVGSTLDPDMQDIMRVSVVATGIDVSEEKLDAPLPRRSMKKPLDVNIEEMMQVEEKNIAPEPMAPEETTPKPEAQEVAEMETEEFSTFESDLFEDVRRSVGVAPTAEQQEQTDEDGLPPPVYQPAPAVEQVSTAANPERPNFGPGVHGQANGEPSTETLARLQAAVNKTPSSDARPTPAPSIHTDDKPSRFGINSLISRMTGQGDREVETPHMLHQKPTKDSDGRNAENEFETERERTDIPAFLRRQAN